MRLDAPEAGFQQRYRRVMSASTEPRPDDIVLGEPAVAQFRERSRPALALPGARAELARLVASGEIQGEPPVWTRTAALRPFCLVIGDTLTLALAAQHGFWVTTTCLVKTTLASRRREQRTRRNAAGTAAKRARRRDGW